MTKRKEELLKREYISRINRVMDYIEDNISEEFTLDRLSSVANFSRFHFHRIFTSITGESLFQFIMRIRLERAASRLCMNPSDTVTRIAYDCGFSSSSAFARAFKNYFNMSASQWRDRNSNICIYESNEGKTQSNAGKAENFGFRYHEDEINDRWRNSMEKSEFFEKGSYKVEVREMEEAAAAYIRYVGPYEANEDLFSRIFERLFKWAGPRGLLNFPETKVISLYHDNPEITEDEKLRTSMCITVPENTEVNGDIGKLKIEGGSYAVGTFELKVDEYAKAWASMFGDWLPESGYEPDGKPCFENYLNDPKEDPEGKHIVEICIPVKPL